MAKGADLGVGHQFEEVVDRHMHQAFVVAGLQVDVLLADQQRVDQHVEAVELAGRPI